jgi:hypothetical protein
MKINGKFGVNSSGNSQIPAATGQAGLYECPSLQKQIIIQKRITIIFRQFLFNTVSYNIHLVLLINKPEKLYYKTVSNYILEAGIKILRFFIKKSIFPFAFIRQTWYNIHMQPTPNQTIGGYYGKRQTLYRW